MAMLAVLGAGLTARRFGLIFGRPIGERRGLTLVATLQHLHLLEQLGDQGFQFGNATFQHDAVGTSTLSHANSVSKPATASCLLPNLRRSVGLGPRLLQELWQRKRR